MKNDNTVQILSESLGKYWRSCLELQQMQPDFATKDHESKTDQYQMNQGDCHLTSGTGEIGGSADFFGGRAEVKGWNSSRAVVVWLLVGLEL